MPTVRHQITSSEYQEISSATGSIYVESGLVSITNQASQPTKTAPVMSKLGLGDDRVIKIKSGDKLYAKCSPGCKEAFITYTEA